MSLIFIIEDANFQPRVLTLPKADFPKDKYDILVKHSKLVKKRHILIQKYNKKEGYLFPVEEEWTPIMGELYSIVEHSCDLLSA